MNIKTKINYNKHFIQIHTNIQRIFALISLKLKINVKKTVNYLRGKLSP